MPYVIVARWRPRDGERDRIEAILRELVSEVRKEPGNLAFVAQRSNDDPYEFLLYEQYESEQAFRDHQQTPHFKRLVLERGVPLLARRERQAFTIVEWGGRPGEGRRRVIDADGSRFAAPVLKTVR
jgi:quinol monooxygenase YgiN